MMFPPKKTLLSFEVFPPKTPAGLINLKQKLDQYLTYQPNFISVTYGAGGSGQKNSIPLASYIQNDLAVSAMAHLICTGHSKTELKSIIEQIIKENIKNIIALRGDPPGGTGPFNAEENDFEFATQLIQLIRQIDPDHQLAIGCAGYPEGHIESVSKHQDLDVLAEKMDAGADFIVTQFFLDNDYFLRFRDRVRRRGIFAPIIAGLLPIANFSQATKFSLMCGCTIPAKVMRGLYGKSDEDQEKFGLEHATKQLERLIKEQVDGVHLYALNKQHAVETLAPIVNQYNQELA